MAKCISCAYKRRIAIYFLKSPNMKKEEEIIETAVVVLPAEVQTLAIAVPEEKRKEVEGVLTQIFQGTSDWKAQVEALQIKGIDDTMNIALADTYRLNAKKARLAAEKVFDSKREEVQALMAGFKTEDALWLKSKQVMQILFKEIEDLAEYKSKFAQRYEMEQRELRTKSRKLKVQELNPEVSQAEYENMSEVTFDMFLGGLRNDKEVRDAAAKKEAEELAKKQEDERVHALRKSELLDYWSYLTGDEKASVFSAVTESVFKDFVATVKQRKTDIDNAAKAQAEENLRLSKLAEEREKQLAKERADAEKARLELLEKQAAELRIQQEAADKKQKELMSENKKREEEAAAKQKALDEEAKIARAIADQKQRELEAELAARKKQEEEATLAQKLATEAQEKARQAAEKAPKKQKMTAWIDGLVLVLPVGLEKDLLVADIASRFEGFKKWAKGEVGKL